MHAHDTNYMHIAIISYLHVEYITAYGHYDFHKVYYKCILGIAGSVYGQLTKLS